MLRSTVAVPCGEPSRRQQPRAHIRRKRRGKSRPVSDRSAATREPASVPAATSSPIPAGAQQPPTGRIPCPEASAPTPDSMPHTSAPPTRNPPRRSLDAQGRTPAGAATLFRVLRPMRCAREQREKLTSGDFYNHVRLRFLPCRHARTACDSRDARHATGAGLRV